MNTVWIIKYALSNGVEEVELLSSDENRWARVQKTNARNGVLHMAPSEWVATKAEALERAEKMRQARLTSLRKQLARIEIQPIKVWDLVR